MSAPPTSDASRVPVMIADVSSPAAAEQRHLPGRRTRRASAWHGYGVAAAAVVVATLVRFAVGPWIETVPLLFYILAILVAAMIAGLRGGVAATVAALLCLWLFFLRSASAETVAVQLGALAFEGFVISLVGLQVQIERLRADATDRELRLALKQSDESQQALAMQARVLESMAEGVCVFTEQGTLLFTNPAFDAMFGYERDALLGTEIADLKDAPADEARRRYAEAVAVARKEGAWQGEQRHRRRDGSTFETQTRITPIRTGDDWCYVCVQEDVTQRRRAEEALQTLNYDLRNRVQEMSTLLDVLPVGIGIAEDSAADNIRPNRALAKLLRLKGDGNASLTAPEGERPTWFRVLQDGKEVAPEDLPLQRAARHGEEVRDLEFDVEFADGTSMRLLEYAAPLLDDQGKARGSIGAFVDITERRAAEHEREQLVAALTKHGRELSVLSSAAQEINKILDAGAVVRTLVRAALRISDASSGVAVLTYPDAPSRPFCQRADDPHRNEGCESDDMGAVRWVLQHRAPYLANDVADDPVVSPRSRERFALRNLVCLPILGRDDELLGCFELHNKAGGFSSGDVVKLQALSAGASIALENARLFAQIREADRRKDDFLAMLAHELRNPLAPLRSAVDFMLMVDDGDDAARQLREVMDRQITHMGRIIDDLLDVSRLSRGRIELRREVLDLSKLVADGVAAHRGIFEAGAHRFEVDVPETPTWVDGDSTRLSQVLDNLLSNARKFTDPGGTIRVRLASDAGERTATLEVEDTGIGVSPEDLGRIFEIFTQADRSLDRRRGGLGLGLALVKGLIDLHGGRVEAHSLGLGHGCTIRVRLPSADPPAASPEQGEVLLAPKSALRVLLIEDNQDAADTLRMLLEAHGYQLEIAADGRQGVEAARRFRPAAVICDIGLPEIDGFEVARTLRADPTLADIRLVALTGYGRDVDVQRAYESGFDDHLTKPADAARVLRILAEVGRAPDAAARSASEL